MSGFETPTSLPGDLEHLSHSSIELYLKCPEKWRRRYLEKQYEPMGGYQIVGRAVHAAEAQSYHAMVETGFPHSIEQVLDEYGSSLDNEQEKGEVEWDGEDPGAMRDRGVGMLAVYHGSIVPAMLPEKVEHEFHVKLHPDNEWTIKGYIDVIGGYNDGFQEHESGPHDIKTVKKAHNYEQSMQASLYTYATMLADDVDKTFRVHELKVLKDGPHADIREVHRTREAQLMYLQRVAGIAREIEYRVTSGNWQGAAPDVWWCSQKYCGYFPTCKFVAR